MSHQDLTPWEETRSVGQAVPRVDAYERVSGAALYPSDVVLPDLLYGAILRCPHPSARVTRLDSAKAEGMPGVRAVVGAATPEADLLWPHSRDLTAKLFDPRCRFEGEAVAAVAAETPYQAWEAVRAIQVAYEVLPFVSDERKALDTGAPLVQDGGNRAGPPDRYERGDVERGWAQADVLLEQTYRTECEIHVPMELHGCVARWDGGNLTVWESTQGVYSVQARVAEVLGLPLSRVRVIGHYVGGAFGSKLQTGKWSIVAAVLARRTGRPVKLFLTREETCLDAGNRPPSNMRLKAGVKRDGTLTALDFSATGTGGAYSAGGTSSLDWLVRDLYLCPNVRTETEELLIHAGLSRPFRAPGHPQCAWALEQMMDALASSLGMDPVELRLRNIPSFSQAREGNPAYTTTGLRECLVRGAEAFGWREARSRVRQRDGGRLGGVGVAACLWRAGGGGPPSTAIVKLFADGSANLNLGASDIGTGTKTVMALILAEELGVDPKAVQIENADTGTTQFATPSGGSKTVPTEGPAVRAAAVEARRQLLEIAARELKADPSDLALDGGQIVSRSDPARKARIADLRAFRRGGVIVGVGQRGPNPEDRVVNPFGAQFCELLVNPRTGEVRVVRFLGAHESGRVMSRLTFDNQVAGGIVMGIGFGLTESRVLDHGQTGRLLTRNLHDYKIPTALDVPAEIESVPVDLGDREANSVGAKGLGEPVTIPTAAAVANALCHATGVRVTRSPATPSELVQLLSPGRKEG